MTLSPDERKQIERIARRPRWTYEDYAARWTDAYRQKVLAEALTIKADGCSGVPDFFLIVCLEHDSLYARHRDLFTGLPVTQEQADLFLKWGIQYHSRFGRWSPMAWWRYRALSKNGLGFGRRAWLTGPLRLTQRTGLSGTA